MDLTEDKENNANVNNKSTSTHEQETGKRHEEYQYLDLIKHIIETGK